MNNTKTKTCDSCKNYTSPDEFVGTFMLDDDKFKGRCSRMSDELPLTIDSCIPWDYESYSAGCYVGPKFGCIHWEAKPEQTNHAE